jgi:hypothetical protein
MEVINQTAHIDKQGVLKLNIPTSFTDVDVQLVVIIDAKTDSSDELDKEQIKLLEDRWEEYTKNPSSTATWQEVKNAILKKYEL